MLNLFIFRLYYIVLSQVKLEHIVYVTIDMIKNLKKKMKSGAGRICTRDVQWVGWHMA